MHDILSEDNKLLLLLLIVQLLGDWHGYCFSKERIPIVCSARHVCSHSDPVVDFGFQVPKCPDTSAVVPKCPRTLVLVPKCPESANEFRIVKQCVCFLLFKLTTDHRFVIFSTIRRADRFSFIFSEWRRNAIMLTTIMPAVSWCRRRWTRHARFRAILRL